MKALSDALQTITPKFTLTTSMLHSIASDLQRSMIDGLSDKPSCLKMLPSYLANPDGTEKGVFIAIDFGGTNVRVLKVCIAGQGGFKIADRRGFPLKDAAAGYDYTSVETSAEDLFDFIAGQIGEIAAETNNGVYPLGFTFSYPCAQHGANHAVLISWSKEIRTTGVEGKDVGDLLEQALKRQKVEHVRPVAIINDTVGTLLTAAYTDRGADVGCICGTGHNTCYLEPAHPLTGRPMIVNIESGNFAGVPRNEYDLILDGESERPGTQHLEKMVSGHYLGEIVRLTVKDYLGGDALSYTLQGGDVAAIVADFTDELRHIAKVAEEQLGLGELNIADLKFIQDVTKLIVIRSARLVASILAGVIGYLDPDLDKAHTVAIDGSLYEKMPGYADYLRGALDEVLPENRVIIRLTKDGSGVGAAIAAATACDSVEI
ncbi:MAG TPA: hexokinase [Methylomusa anaerophila]|uniref:hexokinase n=1 Tax=Methylomusa anaerophila TaxID=1930071 RepID=A0A348AFM0_9FIRM|nr:hexokinase [Methylomusa anaerophila]BBB89868.1 hexokinase [Methylomusa anaerophila]HML89085.1 hexokinase [Methylomusa anaerophila]